MSSGIENVDENNKSKDTGLQLSPSTTSNGKGRDEFISILTTTNAAMDKHLEIIYSHPGKYP